MRKSTVLALLSLGAFTAILFTPSGTNYWIYSLILGIIFGLFWFLRKKS